MKGKDKEMDFDKLNQEARQISLVRKQEREQREKEEREWGRKREEALYAFILPNVEKAVQEVLASKFKYTKHKIPVKKDFLDYWYKGLISAMYQGGTKLAADFYRELQNVENDLAKKLPAFSVKLRETTYKGVFDYKLDILLEVAVK